MSDSSTVSFSMPSLRALTPILAAVGFLFILFWDASANLWSRWGGQQELSHSYFIPLISAWLVWTNRDAVIKSIGGPSVLGFSILLPAIFLLLLGQVTHIFLLQHLAMVFSIAGLVAGFGGVSLLRVTIAPIAFLFFAVPPPYWVITVLSWNFQEMSSILGVAFIKMMDIPVYLTGNIIDLGHYKLAVAEACSGLRYLFPFLSIGVMTAYLFRGPIWGKLLIVASTIPITILMNSFRIGVTGALVQAYGTEHAEGALHFFEGWVVFVMCLAALFAVVWALTFFRKPRLSPFEALGAPDLKPQTPSKSGFNRTIASGFVGVLALVVIGISQVVSTESLIIPERTKFAALPYEFNGWEKEIKPMDPSVAQTLAADDSIVMNVRSPSDEVFNIYMSYLDAQRDGRSWHSPRQCIPGGGWQITKHDIVKGKSPTGEKRVYNRLVIQNRNHRQLVYYWYDQRGRKFANEFVMKFWLMFDAVTRKRSDGAMVRVLTPISPEESVSEGDERLLGLMEKLEPSLPDYVPH